MFEKPSVKGRVCLIYEFDLEKVIIKEEQTREELLQQMTFILERQIKVHYGESYHK